MYERKDRFYKKAKKEGFASRAAYKLIEIQKKYGVFRPGSRVLDLGAAPGSWMQVTAKAVAPKGEVIGIDRSSLKIVLPKNASFIQKKIEEGEENLGLFDVILSDLSPDLSGIAFRDVHQSLELAKLVWKIAEKNLKTNGNLVIKIFPSIEADHFKLELKKSFTSIKTFIPEATRKTSSEFYLIAMGFKRIL